MDELIWRGFKTKAQILSCRTAQNLRFCFFTSQTVELSATRLRLGSFFVAPQRFTGVSQGQQIQLRETLWGICDFIVTTNQS